MSIHYTSNGTKSFSEDGWSKRVIKFLLNTHIEAWKFHCNESRTSSLKAIKSLAHQSLIITVESLFEKGKSLPQQLQKWFPNDINEITKLNLQRLKTWISTTKQLLKLNKPHITDNRKINEFFLPFKTNNISAPQITDSFCPSTIEQETSASISNYKGIIITKSGQYNKSIIININNKNKKENVIEKSPKKIDQTNQYVDNITEQIATPSSSLNKFQDCKGASTIWRSTPTKISCHIQPTFEINVPSSLTNTNLHYDDYIHGSPTKRVRSNSETVLEKANINKNLINENLTENKEANCNKYTIGTDPEDNTEDKDTTCNNSIVNSIDKGYKANRNERLCIKNNVNIFDKG